MYCKGLELALPKHCLNPNLPMSDNLWQWAQNKLRIELRLRTAELKRIGLRQASKWRVATAPALLERYVGKVEMGDSQMTHVDLDERLKPRHRAAVALWKTGADLKSIYSRSAFYRLRADILEAAGIDVGSTANPNNVVPLIRVLEAKPAVLPDWALGMVYHPPVRLRAA